MKHKFYILSIGLLLLCAGGLSAQNIRVKGMGRAFTSIADDQNTLFFNPAGLAFIDDDILFTDIGGTVTFNNQFLEGSSTYEYPNIYPGEDGYYYYFDEFTYTETEFDPADYDLTYTNQEEYQAACQAYMEFYDIYTLYNDFSIINSIRGTGSYGYIAQNWGVAQTENIILVPMIGTFAGVDTSLDLYAVKLSGYHSGLGINLGGVALGGRFSYVEQKAYGFFHTLEDYQSGSAMSLSELMGINIATEDNNYFVLSLGAMIDSGPLTLGATIDDALIFSANSDECILNTLEKLNIGASFNPLKDLEFLNFIAAMDIRNLGSDESRTLNLGLEAELDIFIADTTLRLGYIQPIPGDLSEVFYDIDPRDGLLTAGAGLRLFFATMNLYIEGPGRSLFDYSSSAILDDEFIHYGMDITLAF
jgi:hypothetical protein